MDIGAMIPIVAIIATACIIIQVINYLQFRQVGTNPAADSAAVRENERLNIENDMLKSTVGRLEERMAVLERIATDPAERTAREIESLR
ncbi:MAG TPA: hypothetical protein VF535_05230 [Allosphingosinicella sp.]|jgi:regulator of replication initiation timing